MQDDDRQQAALAAETNPTLVGSALAAVRRRYVWSRHDVARWLEISVDRLGELALADAESAHPARRVRGGRQMVRRQRQASGLDPRSGFGAAGRRPMSG